MKALAVEKSGCRNWKISPARAVEASRTSEVFADGVNDSYVDPIDIDDKDAETACYARQQAARASQVC